MSDRYTAVLSISKTTETTERGGYNEPNKTVRDSNEVVKLVVKAESLEKLRDKLASHVALIED